jgi:hypothetical protein
LPFGQIAPSGGREQDIVHESAEQILGRQHFDPRGRQFQRERQRIEPPANRGHRGAIRLREAKVWLHVPSPFHEQPQRGRAREIGGRPRIDVRIQRERPHDVLPLASHAERGAAGGQHPELGD